MEVRADVTIHLPEVRGSIPHWRCANTTRSHTLHQSLHQSVSRNQRHASSVSLQTLIVQRFVRTLRRISEIYQRLCVDFAGYKTINIYKTSTLVIHTKFPCPSLHVIFDFNFNCQHVNWGYNKTYPDSESLNSWATSTNFGLLYHRKETASFASQRWNVGTNPDLAFFGQDNRLPDRRVLGNARKTLWRKNVMCL